MYEKKIHYTTDKAQLQSMQDMHLQYNIHLQFKEFI